MKVLLVNKFLYPKGGDAISTISTGRLLSAKKHKVIFWGMEHPLNPEYPYNDYFVPYVDFNRPDSIKNKVRISLNLLYSLEAKRKIESLINIEKPDIVHLNNFAHQISPSILRVFAKHKIPIVMTMHDYKLVCASYLMLNHGKTCEICKDGRYYHCFLEGCVKDSKSKSLLNTVEMYLHHKILHIYDLVDVFISPSRFLKAKLEKMGFKKKIVYLPNFVRLEDFEPQYNWEEKSIVYFGRLSKEKGAFTLIDAMKNVEGAVLKVIGEGPIRNSLEARVRSRKTGIKDKILFLGYKTGEGLKDEIRKSMFVVLPSEWFENHPFSVVEAFTLGKPVVGSRIGGIPELVKDNETGLTFEPGNTDDLSSKIEYLINKPDKIIEMGKKAREFVEKELNAERYYQGLMEIYKKADSCKNNEV